MLVKTTAKMMIIHGLVNKYIFMDNTNALGKRFAYYAEDGWYIEEESGSYRPAEESELSDDMWYIVTR